MEREEAMTAKEGVLLNRMARALAEFGQHDEDCILSGYSQGRPTPDGGYETMYRGKWYRTAPKCECGFHDALDICNSVLVGPEAISPEGEKIVPSKEGAFARAVKIEYSDAWALQFQDGPLDEDGCYPILIQDCDTKEAAELGADIINTAVASRLAAFKERAAKVVEEENDRWRSMLSFTKRLDNLAAAIRALEV